MAFIWSWLPFQNRFFILSLTVFVLLLFVHLLVIVRVKCLSFYCLSYNSVTDLSPVLQLSLVNHLFFFQMPVEVLAESCMLVFAVFIHFYQ